MVFDSAKNEIYASDANGTLAPISDQNNSVVATLALKQATPWIMTYDSGKHEIFGVDFNSNALQRSVSAISDVNYSVTANITQGYLPSDITYDSSKGEVFVSNALPGSLSIIPNELPTSALNVTIIVAVSAVVVISVCAGIVVLRRLARASTKTGYQVTSTDQKNKELPAN